MTRAQRVEQVLADLLQRRAAGELVSDQQIITEHADLQPELADALSFTKRIVEARERPSASEILPAEPLRLLSHEELDAPIQLSAIDENADGPTEQDSPPKVSGYTVVNEIARGGQAVVYRARQHSTEQLVAIKVLFGGRFASPQSRARFDREASILATLNHPDIVGIIDRGRTADGFDYIVMPFIEGPDVRRILRHNWSQSWPTRSRETVREAGPRRGGMLTPATSCTAT